MQAGYVRVDGERDLGATSGPSSLAVRRDLPQTSVSLTRGGPLMGRGPGWTTVVNVGNRAGAQTRVDRQRSRSAATTTARRRNRISGLLSVRPGPRWQLSAEPYYDRIDRAAAVRQHAGGRAARDLRSPLRVRVHRSQHDADGVPARRSRVKPDMNLDVYAEPFAASGRYYDYGELLAPAQPRAAAATAPAARRSSCNPDGSQTVDGRRRDVHAAQPRLQHAVVPQQRGAAVGMASGQHALRRVAAGPRRHRSRAATTSAPATCSAR